jgi:hypothetical protein
MYYALLIPVLRIDCQCDYAHVVYEFLIRAGIFEYVMYYALLICILRISDPGWKNLTFDVSFNV